MGGSRHSSIGDGRVARRPVLGSVALHCHISRWPVDGTPGPAAVRSPASSVPASARRRRTAGSRGPRVAGPQAAHPHPDAIGHVVGQGGHRPPHRDRGVVAAATTRRSGGRVITRAAAVRPPPAPEDSRHHHRARQHGEGPTRSHHRPPPGEGAPPQGRGWSAPRGAGAGRPMASVIRPAGPGRCRGDRSRGRRPRRPAKAGARAGPGDRDGVGGTGARPTCRSGTAGPEGRSTIAGSSWCTMTDGSYRTRHPSSSRRQTRSTSSPTRRRSSKPGPERRPRGPPGPRSGRSPPRGRGRPRSVRGPCRGPTGRRCSGPAAERWAAGRCGDRGRIRGATAASCGSANRATSASSQSGPTSQSLSTKATSSVVTAAMAWLRAAPGPPLARCDGSASPRVDGTPRRPPRGRSEPSSTTTTGHRAAERAEAPLERLGPVPAGTTTVTTDRVGLPRWRGYRVGHPGVDQSATQLPGGPGGRSTLQPPSGGRRSRPG